MPTTMTPSKEIWVFSQTPVADSFRRFFDPLTYTRSPGDSGGISFIDHKSLWNNVKHNRASRKPSQGDNVIVNVTFVISVNETHRYSSSNSSFSVQTYWQVCVDYGRLGKSTLVDQKLNPTTFEDSNTFANKPDPNLFGIVDITHPLNILRYTIQYYTILYYTTWKISICLIHLFWRTKLLSFSNCSTKAANRKLSYTFNLSWDKIQSKNNIWNNTFCPFCYSLDWA